MIELCKGTVIAEGGDDDSSFKSSAVLGFSDVRPTV